MSAPGSPTTEVGGRTAFEDAVTARDLDALRASLAPDVRFYSPVRYSPFVGRDEVAAVLSIPATVFVFHDSFRYTRTLIGPDRCYGLFFEAEVDGRFLEGVDHLQLDEDGLVVELRIMLRPLAQVQAFAEKASELFARIGSGGDAAGPA